MKDKLYEVHKDTVTFDIRTENSIKLAIAQLIEDGLYIPEYGEYVQEYLLKELQS